ncbi:MAG: PEP-CTERM sorting domain-containing protein [Hydrococcus sp. RU_2_2]|nr:PEP-CTERM sorting domain-containing protein [Hydrococcus sp. RU_2_2]
MSALSATTEEVSNSKGTSVPEPTSVLGLFAFGFLGSFSSIKHHLRRPKVL